MPCLDFKLYVKWGLKQIFSMEGLSTFFQKTLSTTPFSPQKGLYAFDIKKKTRDTPLPFMAIVYWCNVFCKTDLEVLPFVSMFHFRCRQTSISYHCLFSNTKSLWTEF